MKTQAREIRFIAKSAQEAVDRVCNELGPEAQVISVRQVTGSGLQRFLTAPQLEIVAREVEAKSEVPTANSEPKVTPDPAPVKPLPAKARITRDSLSCGNFLSKAGFSPALMARLEGAESWREIQSLSLEQGLPRAITWLRKYRSSLKESERPTRLAFLGGPGSGKTTALCKYLAREVFIHGRQPEVLRLEVDKPHLDNGLSLYCEILGVNCREDPSEIDFSDDQSVLVDVPGFSIQADSEKERIREGLDAIGVNDRVLVLNAANEASVMQRFVRDGVDLGAKYQVLTHLDELVDFGKLWACLLDLEREVLFFSNGQNVAGDIVEDTFGFLIERTFPR